MRAVDTNVLVRLMTRDNVKQVAIADAFVAMTSDRPYRRRRTRDEAIHILAQGAGKQWDAVLVEQFLRLIAETGADAVTQARSAG